ncbi:MAG: NADP-specific glutamate dehydrogenase [Planctomycetota bacterium]
MAATEYLNKALDEVKRKNPHEPEFIQAVTEVFSTVRPVIEKHPEYQQYHVLERLTEPERVVTFRVPWQDDKNRIRLNRGYRVRFNSALGPYKGGLRFHPTVNLSVCKFLAFEQVLKNALTGLPLGGGKGGSDFDPKGKSDNEVMRFCQSFVTELYRFIGPSSDVPAGDIGVGLREVGYMFGQHKRITGEFEYALTGKDVKWGGSYVRKEATGYGLIYFVEEMLRGTGKTLDGLRVSISGSGNVAIYAAEKAGQLGATVAAMSDSDGYVHHPDGIRVDLMKQIKEVERKRIRAYADECADAEYHEGSTGIWSIPVDVALPCATQNELDEAAARTLAANGTVAVAEGANMPTTNEGIDVFQEAGVQFGPGKAANAGGVATSGLEMSQNSLRLQWSFAEVDSRLKTIMENVYRLCSQTADECNAPGNLVAGANIAGFTKVADATIDQGLV